MQSAKYWKGYLEKLSPLTFAYPIFCAKLQSQRFPMCSTRAIFWPVLIGAPFNNMQNTNRRTLYDRDELAKDHKRGEVGDFPKGPKVTV